MRWKTKLFAVTFLVLGLSACDDNDEAPATVATPPAVVNADLLVVHAVSDAPDVQVSANGAVAVQDLGYGAAAGPLSLAPGVVAAKVDARLPGGALATVIPGTNLTLEQDNDYLVFATGKAADASISPVVISTSDRGIASGNLRLQVLHAAAGAPTVDVHLTAPDAAIGAGTVTATLAFKEDTGSVDVPAGNYRVRITLPGQLAPVFDSGTIALPAGANFTVAAIDNRFSGPSPVSLLAIENGGDRLDIMDAGTTASVRAVHDVSDAPAVDVLVDGAKAFSNLAFPEFTGYAGLAPDTYKVQVAAAADNSLVVIDADLPLEKGKFYSVHALGSFGNNSIEALVLEDHPRRIATAAQLRVVHGSTLAGAVDLYLTATADISGATPTLTNLPFKADSGYLQVPAGDYFVTVTAAGNKTAAIGPVAVELMANKIYTAVARDGAGLGADVGLILLDDFVN
ncbi:DUF4397 domain-containing protein [Rheinheimera sp.]|uniref:DUF4397 domain-containing protein n=1 Tax=Rheinheimera sp. TaxID=1869214 RepID=UPI00307CF6E0